MGQTWEFIGKAMHEIFGKHGVFIQQELSRKGQTFSSGQCMPWNPLHRQGQKFVYDSFRLLKAVAFEKLLLFVILTMSSLQGRDPSGGIGSNARVALAMQIRMPWDLLSFGKPFSFRKTWSHRGTSVARLAYFGIAELMKSTAKISLSLLQSHGETASLDRRLPLSSRLIRRLAELECQTQGPGVLWISCDWVNFRPSECWVRIALFSMQIRNPILSMLV